MLRKKLILPQTQNFMLYVDGVYQPKCSDIVANVYDNRLYKDDGYL
eukprot:CAMPEP_0116946492 /NCGR_PEP_ID=MMETSP0467-20121206/37019_1 /TAXON_ID=283647 /ORGANISM="Mesodinium pulex, Strain SPMC105" /LENGTH=45 /DNA_ID= /DNA_START= /DNA_END= /DNA_ORIENTATION=